MTPTVPPRVWQFNSATYGKVGVPGVLKHLALYFAEDKAAHYRIIVGSDSQGINHTGADFVTAIIVHRVGNGGIYFWHREHTKVYSMRDRIYKEAMMSLEIAQTLVDSFAAVGLLGMSDLEIHCDVGKDGATRELIAEVVGMIRGSGFEVKVKPDSFGASKVADRHT